MILCFGLSDDWAREMWKRHEFFDRTRGIRLNSLPITYLDTDVGYYHVLLKDADGQYYADPADPDEVAGESRLCEMSVTPKASE